MSRRGWLLFAALSFLWGVPYLMIRVAVRDLDPTVVVFGRCAVGALILLPIAVHRGALAPALRHWRMLLVYSAVEILGPWWLIGYAETRLNSSTTGLLIAGVPMVTALIMLATRQESLGVRRALGLLVGFGGVAALVGLDIDVSNLAAVAALALTCVGYAIGAILIGRAFPGAPALGIITWSLLIGAAVYLPFLFIHRPTTVSTASLASVIGLGSLCTAAAFVVMFALIAEVGASRATVFTYVAPAVSIVVGALVLDEPLTLGLAAGFPLILFGSWLATRTTRAPAEA